MANGLSWAIRVAKPLRIAYLSCSAGTFSKDLAVLNKGEFRVERLIPFDFFPGTHHIEVLALLSRQN
jgi:23S rRNA (uracil1939-C5)-methyltransferase